MAKTVADGLWEMLYAAGVRRCYGIVGDALNPTIDALRRQGSIEFVHVRHEEFGVFAAVADSCLTGQPTAVCGTSGPGAAHLINGLLDARKEGAPVIAIAGDVDSAGIDSDIVEELNPYKFFDAAALYIGRLVNPAQVRTVVTSAVSTAIAERGPVVIALPGDVAASNLPHGSLRLPLPAARPASAVEDDLAAMAELINSARTVAIFGGQGCAGAEAEVLALAGKLSAPVGYTLRGKQWIEAGNPNAVGMTGLIGYGGAYQAMHDADVLLLLGTDFPFPEFLPHEKVKVIQIDRDARHLGRRVPLELAVTGDVEATLAALLDRVDAKPDRSFLDQHLRHSTQDQADPAGIRRRDAQRAGRRRRAVLRRHRYRVHLDRPLPRARRRPALVRVIFVGLDGQCLTKCLRRPAGLSRPANHRHLRRRRLHHARPR